MLNSFIQEVRERVNQYGKGHDFSHIERVVKNALEINKVEKESEKLVLILAYCHDLFDEKFYHHDDFKDELRDLLSDIELSNEEFDTLYLDLKNFGFKGGLQVPQLSKVGQIVSDADRLDAIGAIGIARTMMYGDTLYDRNIEYKPITSKDEYRSHRPILFHFYDKLLKLKDLMFTKTGKQMAQQRHQFMLEYLEQLNLEIDYKVTDFKED